MPQLDAISPNPKQPKRKPRVDPLGITPLPADVVERRRKTMWAVVGGIFLVILVVWFSTLGSRLKTTGNNSAWDELKDKFSGIFNVFQSSSSGALKNIDINAPTQQDIQTLQQQVFPNADAVTGQSNANANVNTSSSVNGNVNQAANQNTNAN